MTRSISIVVGLSLILALAVTCFGYRQRENVQDAYAVEWVTGMTLEHLNEGSARAWPRGWEDLRGNYKKQAVKGADPWTFEDLQQRVEVDWKADTAYYTALAHQGDKSKFAKLIVAKGNESASFESFSAQEVLYRYFVDRAPESSTSAERTTAAVDWKSVIAKLRPALVHLYDPPAYKMQGLKSAFRTVGVVVDSQGYVVLGTSGPVNLQAIAVTHDGRSLKGAVVKGDASKGVQVFQLGIDQPLPTVELGDHSRVQVGDGLLLAIPWVGPEMTIQFAVLAERRKTLAGERWQIDTERLRKSEIPPTSAKGAARMAGLQLDWGLVFNDSGQLVAVLSHPAGGRYVTEATPLVEGTKDFIRNAITK